MYAYLVFEELWIFRYFVERMDCHGTGQDDLWNDLFSYLQQSASATERLFVLSSSLKDILTPFGIADPTVALGCPLGTSAALQVRNALQYIRTMM